MAATTDRHVLGIPLDRRTFISFAVLVLIASLVATYSLLSYHSVNGTHPELVKVSRTIGSSSLSVTYYLEVHVWSWAGSLDTNVGDVFFSLVVDDLSLGTRKAPEGSFHPYNYISYSLEFETSDVSIASTIRGNNPNRFLLAMSANVDAGWYTQQVNRSDSATWTWEG